MKILIYLSIFLCFLSGCDQSAKSNGAPMRLSTSETFSGEAPEIAQMSSLIDYDWSILTQEFIVAVPEVVDPEKKYGLVVYIGSGHTAPAEEWSEVLYRRDLLFISPKGAGNRMPSRERMGKSVLAAELMKRDYNIDPERVYISGLSGGARTANAIAFLHPETFSGAILSCGAGFLREVPQVKERVGKRVSGAEYTVIIDPSYVDEETVKEKVRFALITGPDDYRQGNLIDIYQGGYKPSGFKAKLFDVPGMGHHDCSPEIFDNAIEFIEANES